MEDDGDDVFQITCDDVWKGVVVSESNRLYMSIEEIEYGATSFRNIINTYVGVWPMSTEGMYTYSQKFEELQQVLSLFAGMYSNEQLDILRRSV